MQEHAPRRTEGGRRRSRRPWPPKRAPSLERMTSEENHPPAERLQLVYRSCAHAKSCIGCLSVPVRAFDWRISPKQGFDLGPVFKFKNMLLFGNVACKQLKVIHSLPRAVGCLTRHLLPNWENRWGPRKDRHKEYVLLASSV